MPDVLYKEIAGLRGYRVGSDGTVWSQKQPNGGVDTKLGDWHILRLTLCKNGYVYAKLWHDGKHVTKTVHSLVLEAFVGPRPHRADACHNNGNKTDNRLENLRWGSRTENNREKREHGTLPLGAKHWKAKLNDDVVRAIRSAYANGVPCCDIARLYGASYKNVNQIVHRKTWTWLT